MCKANCFLPKWQILTERQVANFFNLRLVRAPDPEGRDEKGCKMDVDSVNEHR